MSAKLLEVAERNTILDQFGDKHPLPSNSSKTIRFTREEKLDVPVTPLQLTEGVAPAAQGITVNQFEATTEQYGALVILSDLAELTARHNLIERSIYILGLNAAEIYDQLIFNVLDASTTGEYFVGGGAADTDLVATDLPAYGDLVELDATLQDNGGRPFESGEYVFLCAPQVYAGLLKDPDFKASNQYQAPQKIWQGEVGTLGGFRVVRSNSPAFNYTSQSNSGKANKVYSSFAVSRFAY
ncbi:MAG: N4-gp56 family major capsid protein, partial [Thaumarchaeota archaeon]|nr:N4-gp56 family major capsid protein [Nitrososphaerota archaeon]